MADADGIARYAFPTYYVVHLAKLVETKAMWLPQPDGSRCINVSAVPELRRFDDYLSMVFDDALARYRADLEPVAGYTLFRLGLGEQVPVARQSALYFVHDDYDGGDLVLPDKIKLRASPGEVIVVPPTPSYEVSVEPVTRGVCYFVRCAYTARS